ncbi:MAG TPA: RDD family protein [Pyrinomonadaceae bacterium]|nr:RDD family protein [Pyrinomonadaceae bacterium]
MNYAGFWQRFAAAWIDTFVLFIPILFFWWLQSVSRPVAIAALLPHAFLLYAYEIYFHGRSGQTIGKKNQNIRVVSLDGGHISWKQAFLRSSVGVGMGFLSMISLLVALLKITDEEFANLGWLELSSRQSEIAPFSMEIAVATMIWAWSEVVIMLLNRKRRALHDFIAGTVVVDESYRAKAEPASGAQL